MTEWWHRPPWWVEFREETAWRWKQVYHALRQWCEPWKDEISRSDRIKYTLKAVICVILGRNDVHWMDDRVYVADWDHRSISYREGSGVDWRTLAVSKDRWAARVEVHGAP